MLPDSSRSDKSTILNNASRKRAASQQIETPRNRWFHMVLNMADDDLGPYEYRLLGHYIRVGTCTESVRTTSDKCHMSATRVIQARSKLEALGYIKTIKRPNDTLLIFVLDRMAENVARYSKDDPDLEHEETSDPKMDHGVPDLEHGVPKTTHKEEPYNKNQERIHSEPDGSVVPSPSNGHTGSALALMIVEQPKEKTLPSESVLPVKEYNPAPLRTTNRPPPNCHAEMLQSFIDGAGKDMLTSVTFGPFLRFMMELERSGYTPSVMKQAGEIYRAWWTAHPERPIVIFTMGDGAKSTIIGALELFKRGKTPGDVTRYVKAVLSDEWHVKNGQHTPFANVYTHAAAIQSTPLVNTHDQFPNGWVMTQDGKVAIEQYRNGGAQ